MNQVVDDQMRCWTLLFQFLFALEDTFPFFPACDCFQALQIYSKTVELGLPLEPSYVVERYLDAQRRCKGYCGHGRDIVAIGFAHGSAAS